MSRWKASLIHLVISAVIAIAVLALMLLTWYPHPLFAAVGGQQVLMILLGVDVALGPLATLVVFGTTNKSRKALTFDLSIIATLQVAALIYGMSVVFQARPVFVVFSVDTFELVTANLLTDEDIAKAKHPNYRSLPLTSPVYVYTEMPTDPKERNDVVFSAFSGKDIPLFPQYYQPFSEHKSAAGKAAKPIAQLRKLNPEHTADIDRAIRNSGRAEIDLGYIPLRAKYLDLAVLVGKNDGEVLTLLKLRPW